MSKFAKAALWYARHGWHVFPVIPGQKEPLTPRGFHDATVDTEQIRKWWTQHPHANIGIATGASGLVAVDIDPKNGGDATYEALRSELGCEVFDTLTQMTPSGGQHFVYATDGTAVKSGGSVLGQGIDIRAIGGYIVAAPSVVNRKEYRWEAEYSPTDRKPAIWPDELAAKIVSRAVAPTLEENTQIPSGERNATLASIAGTLRRRGLGFDEILAALRVTNEKRCVPTLPDADVQRIAQSISRYAPSESIGTNRVSLPDVKAEEELIQATVAFDRIHNRKDDFGEPLPFGVRRLDDKLGGMYPGMVTVLAARTGVGKTAFAEHIIQRASRSGPTLYFALEMGAKRIIERMAARRMGMPVRQYREAGRPMDNFDWLESMYLQFVDKSNRITIQSIRGLVEAHVPKLVVIDHARHINGWLPRDGRMRADLSPAFIMQELSEIAEQVNTHILLLSQVNREADGTRPTLADLRDSGSVEENADNVIFLHRPFQFGDPDPPETLDRDANGALITDDVVEVCCWKSREAGSFVGHMGWRGPLMQFYDYPIPAGMLDRAQIEARYERCCTRKTKARGKSAA